jgi:DNA mismatch repair protein MutS
MVIKGGRHPIIEKVQKHHSFIENDTFLSSLDNFVIITGCNGAGKTVSTDMMMPTCNYVS